MSSVTVDFNANIARFTSALDKATNDLNKFQSNAERMSGNISKAFGALGVGLSVAGIMAFTKSAIDAADKLTNLAAATGLTVEQLSGLQLAAKKTGTDLDGIAASVNKLSVNIGKDAAKFAEIGITAKDPIKAFQQLADIFVGIKDPQERAAFGAVALGKSWAIAAPLLAQGGQAIGEMVDKGMALAGNIAEMAARSNDFNDKLDEMQQKTQGFITNALVPLLPMMLTTANYMSDTGDKAKAAGEKMTVLTIAFQAVAVVGANVGYTFNVLGMHLTRIVEQANALAHGDFKGFTEIGKAIGDGIKQAEIDLNAFTNKILNPEKPKDNAAPSSVHTPQTKIVKFIGGAGASDAAAENKKRLENNLKMLEDSVKSEADTLAFRNKILDFYYGTNLVSIKDYYANKKTAQDLALNATLADYDNEIEALKKYSKNGLTSDVEKIAAAGKINELLAKKSGLIKDSAENAAFANLQQSKAADDLNKALGGLNAQYLTMNNQLGEAAGLTFDLANAQLKERLTVEGNIGALTELEKLRARAVENASTAGEDGFSRSMRNYVNIASDSGKQIENLMTNAFKGAEDALVNFVKTGKLDVRSLFDSITSDMIRMQVQQQVTGPLAQWGGDFIKGLFSANGGGGMAGMNQNMPIMSYAVGTDYVPQDMVAKIHKGERIVPAAQNNGGGITPNDKMGRGITVVNNFTLNQPADRRTQEQIAAMAGASIQNAMMRGA